jgi:hypothetical protein
MDGAAVAEEGQRLYDLLPALYRVRDAAQSQPLRALMGVIGREARTLEDDIGRLYGDWFIETCSDWIVPYLGDLLGVRGLGFMGAGVAGQRAFVANTLRYRRRKGTIAAMEQLARDLSGWPAHAVEFFLRLATTQNVNHVRLENVSTVDLRDPDAVGLLGSPFDRSAHLAEVRHVDIGRGRYDIPYVGVFLWRLQAYPIQSAPAFRAGDGRYCFSPLGHDAPLFTRPQTETSVTHLAAEENVPGPIRPGALSSDLRSYRRAFADQDPAARPSDSAFYGPNRTFSVERDGETIPPIEVVCADLSRWDRPAAGTVAVDVRSGRLSFASGEDPAEVRVSFAYGFAGDLGGGPYDRRGSLADPEEDTWIRTVSRTDPDADFDSLAAALGAWADPTDGAKEDAVITVTDSDVYTEELVVEPGSASLVIQARQGARPLVRPTDAAGAMGELSITGGTGSEASLALDGLLIEGAIRIDAESLGTLATRHCTFVPGRSLDPVGGPRDPDLPSIVADAPNERLNVVLEHTIVGPVRLPADAESLAVRDGIVDAPAARRVPVLVSGGLSPFPDLSSPTPSVDITVGAEGPHTAQLGAIPGTLTEARDLLQDAIRSASPTAPFTQTRVLSRNNRLVVVPGSTELVRIEDSGSDLTATELRLDPSSAQSAQAMFTATLAPFPDLNSPMPAVAVSMGPEESLPAPLGAVPASIPQARDELEAAIRAAGPDVAFAQALVIQVDDRLAIVPGTPEGWVSFVPTAADPTTVVELGLQERVPAISSPQPGPSGDGSAPPTTFEGVTVFGRCLVRELTLGSNVIFTEPVVAERRQVGCTRFAFVPETSRVPRRYRCQPPNADVRPHFVSTTYGQPGYAQLAPTCPAEIAAGADDESEMGAFHFLHQPQRLENVRNGLDEYLPFGLEAGIFLVT